MPVLLLSMLVLLFSWTAAHLFAVPTTYLVRVTHLYNIPVFRRFRSRAGKKAVGYLRKLIFAALLIVLGLLLAAVLGIQPVHPIWKGYIQNFVDFELTQTLMSGLLDNLVLALGIFIVLQTIAFVNEFFPRLYEVLEKWRHTRFHVLRFQKPGTGHPRSNHGRIAFSGTLLTTWVEPGIGLDRINVRPVLLSRHPRRSLRPA